MYNRCGSLFIPRSGRRRIRPISIRHLFYASLRSPMSLCARHHSPSSSSSPYKSPKVSSSPLPIFSYQSPLHPCRRSYRCPYTTLHQRRKLSCLRTRRTHEQLQRSGGVCVVGGEEQGRTRNVRVMSFRFTGCKKKSKRETTSTITRESQSQPSPPLRRLSQPSLARPEAFPDIVCFDLDSATKLERRLVR